MQAQSPRLLSLSKHPDFPVLDELLAGYVASVQAAMLQPDAGDNAAALVERFRTASELRMLLNGSVQAAANKDTTNARQTRKNRRSN